MVRTPPKRTRPSRDAEATRTAILDAAEEEFARNGLEAARTESIAAHTGVTKAMIYYYFQSKEDLYLAVLRRAFADRAQASLCGFQIDQLPPEVALETFLRKVIQITAANPNVTMILCLEGIQNKGKYYQKAGVQRLYEVLATILERGIVSGVFQTLDPTHMAVNLIGLCNFYFITRENIKHLWPGQPILSKAMVEQHQEVALRMALASVLR